MLSSKRWSTIFLSSVIHNRVLIGNKARIVEKRKDAITVDAVSSYKDKIISSIEGILENRMPFTDMGVGEVEGLKQALIIINGHD